MHDAFEWDEAKRESNLRKHGLDFRDALDLLDGRPVVASLSPRGDEERWMTVGALEGRLVTVVWTERPGATRIISLRRARVGEERAYREIYG